MVDPYNVFEPGQIYQMLENLPSREQVKIKLNGMDFFGDKKETYVNASFANLATAEEKLDDYGISLYEESSSIYVSTVKFGSKAYNSGIEMHSEIISLSIKNKQPSEWFIYIPAALLLLLIYLLQSRRRNLSLLRE